ncbi:MAG: phosphate propanoyltransferase [Oscillospiraceae bacterium]
METQKIEYITKLVVDALSAAQQTPGQRDQVPVGVSARHIHLTQQCVETLFGAGHQLTKKKELMGGQFACEETVTLVSPKMKIMERVRVLGPLRKASQVEISSTDAMKLGMQVPLRESGDIAGSPAITVVGPKGTVVLPEGCIVAARHIHMSTEDAKQFGVTDGQIVSVRTGGSRATLYGAVKIRVDPSFTLEMHIDTDEAGAAGIKNGDCVTLVK